MKTYLKTLGRMFSKHITRFISIIFIVLISVGFSSGVGSSTDKIQHSLNNYYAERKVPDFIVKSSEDGGFSDEDVENIVNLFAEEEIAPTVSTGMSVDVDLSYPDGESRLTRIYFLDEFPQFSLNIPDEISSSDQETDLNQAFAERANKTISGVELGTEIELDFVDILDQLSIQNTGEGLDDNTSSLISRFVKPVTVKVTKTLQSPMTIALDGEPSYVNGEDVELPETGSGLDGLVTVDNILYVSSDIIPSVMGTALLGKGDIYIAIGDRDIFSSFSGGYKDYVEEMSDKITALMTPEGGESTVRVLTLYDNFSLYSLNSYAEKVEALSWVLVVAFMFVTALVVFSNISRLMEEERGQIACLRTLGYSPFRIIFKYALFALIATGIGGVCSYFVGVGLSSLIYYIFNFSYAMPAMSAYFAMNFFYIVFSIIVVAIFLATLFSGIKMMLQQPAELLRPKPPKAGKKVIFERMPFLWNRLPFRYKSTVRNVLRYKSRFFMTVIAVAVSMALVMAGLSILDLCLFGSLKSPSIVAIAVVVIIFAGLLTATVIYTMTNINISERNRELATLMVLGYHDNEVSGYIHREIYIDTLIGIIFGYPLAALLIWLVFTMIGLGTLGGISWFMWLIAPFVVVAFALLVTLLLRRKIVKIDMNESLKAIE